MTEYRRPYYSIRNYDNYSVQVYFDEVEWEIHSIKRFAKDLTPFLNENLGLQITQETLKNIDNKIHDFISQKISQNDLWHSLSKGFLYENDSSECLNCMSDLDVERFKK